MNDNFLQRSRNIRINTSWQLCNIMHMHNCNRNRIISIKRFLTCQHLIKHNSYGVKIAFSVSNISPCLFRTYIVNSTYSLVGRSFSLFTGKFCNTEIHDLNSTVCKHHYILRLDIPVYNTSFMSMLKRPENLCYKMHSVLPA